MVAFTERMAQGGPLAIIPSSAAANPGLFESLRNALQRGVGSIDDATKGASAYLSKAVTDAGGGKAVAGKIAGKYLPIAGAGLSVMQGDVGGAIGGLGGMAVGSLLGPVGALGGSVVGGMLGTATQKGIGGLLQNVPGAVGNIARTTMAQGTSPNVIPGTGGKSIESMSMDEIRELVRLQPQLAEQLEGVNNRTRDAELNRTMQLNQQTGQLTGALNQQRYMAQLAGGAQSEAGATTRSILTAQNPYAASAFSYRG